MSPFLVCFTLLIKHCLSGYGAKDSTLNIEKRCGEAYSISLTYDSMERQVSIYIPKIFCDDNKFTQSMNQILGKRDIPFDPSSHQITIPMLISMHCLTCAPTHEISKWSSFAEQFTFILLAPKGIKSSWNGDQCCGPAVDDQVDDVGFIQTIINGAQTSFSQIFPFATVSNENDDAYVWLSGYSNGAFMADKIAWISAGNQFSKLVAVAPLAGYIYDNTKYIDNKHDNQSVAVFLHHSKTDTMVNGNGCCMDQTEGCCCGIASKSSTCLTIYEEYEHWLQWNHCNGDISFEGIKIDYSTNDDSIPVTCAFATPDKHGCDRYTSLCMYGGDTGHLTWMRSVPQSNVVMVFFLKSLCLQQGGTFNGIAEQCECDRESLYDGLYCITPKTALGMGVMDTMRVIDKKEIKDDKTIVLNDNEREDVVKRKETVMNGKESVQIQENKDLSVLGNAADKFADKTFEFDSFGDESESWSKMPNASMVLIGSMLFASIGLFVMYKKKQSGYRYSKVNMHDDEPSHELLDNDLEL